ncbi:MAG TPA: transketolase [Trebonia sp.]|jgi:transketolase|nr:transketolase [Trebonia sp.]
MSTSSLLERDTARELREIAQQLRVDSVRCSSAANSGHPTSSLSAADLMAVLIARHLRYDYANPAAPGNDHLIFSKGHASPLYYALLRAVGAIADEELVGTYRKAGSRLEGHPTPVLPWTDVATGSLGQGLPVGAGIALAGQRLDRLPYRVWALCGDSELAEGSIWEAAEQASYSGLDNLTAIVDVNRLGQRGPTRHGWDTGAYAARFAAFGWHTIEIDGHDIEAIDRAYAEAAATSGRPTVILARTRKGRGVAAVEDKEGAHGKPVPDADEAIRELGGVRDIRVHVTPPSDASATQVPPVASAATRGAWRPPAYEKGSMAATRTAFGAALAALGDVRADVVVLDGEVADSTRAQSFADAHPDRFFECYIAEQQLIAAAVGLQVRGWVPYAATFAAFLTRAYDFIRMAAVSRASIRLVGSHTGVAIGQDGPSQMGLEDLAALRAVHGSTVLSPCDANQAAWLTGAMADISGVSYLRTARGDLPVIYEPGERFEIGGSRVLRSAPDDQVTLVATGVTVHEALAAADLLEEDGVSARVIDAYSVKPIDAPTLREAAAATGRIVTVEDHWPEGGLGDAVLAAVAAGGAPLPVTRKLAVTSMPGSATPEEQLQLAGIDMASIATAAAELIAGHVQARLPAPGRVAERHVQRSSRGTHGTAERAAEHGQRGAVPARASGALDPDRARGAVLRDDPAAAGPLTGHRGVQRPARVAGGRRAVPGRRWSVPARGPQRRRGPHRRHARRAALAPVHCPRRLAGHPVEPVAPAVRRQPADRRAELVRAQPGRLRPGGGPPCRELRRERVGRAHARAADGVLQRPHRAAPLLDGLAGRHRPGPRGHHGDRALPARSGLRPAAERLAEHEHQAQGPRGQHRDKRQRRAAAAGRGVRGRRRLSWPRAPGA